MERVLVASKFYVSIRSGARTPDYFYDKQEYYRDIKLSKNALW